MQAGKGGSCKGLYGWKQRLRSEAQVLKLRGGDRGEAKSTNEKEQSQRTGPEMGKGPRKKRGLPEDEIKDKN